MLKKIMLVVVAAVFLIGTESLFAADKKKAEPTQRQAARAPQQQKSRTLQVARQKAAREAQAKRAEEMRKKRQQEAMQKKRQQEAAKKAQALRGKKPQEEAAKKKSATQSRVSRRPQQSRTGQNLLPMQQMFGKWLDEMNKAYRDNDRQKMGQLLRRMQQLTQRVQQAGTTAGQRWQQFRDGRTGIERPRPGLSISPRGMWGCGRGRCMMGRGGPGFQGRGMMGRGGPGFQGRGMMGRGGPGFQGRVMMGRSGPDMPPGPPKPDSSRSRRPGRFVPELKDAKPESRRPGSRND